MDNLKTRAIHGGIASWQARAPASLYVSPASRFSHDCLSPGDFGIVAMMTVVTGFLDIMSSAGLSPATVQSATITDQQRSNLFWINVACSVVLGLMCILAAPLIVSFYGEPRLLWVAPAFALIFLLNGMGGQHSALIERQLRYSTLTDLRGCRASSLMRRSASCLPGAEPDTGRSFSVLSPSRRL